MTEYKETKPSFSSVTAGFNWAPTQGGYDFKVSMSPQPLTANLEIGRMETAGTAESLYLKAGELLSEEQWVPAVRCYRQALAIKPEYPEALNKLGIAYIGMGDSVAAIECFLQALALMPGLGEAHYKLGTVYQRQGRLDEAIDCFEKAVRLQPDFGDAHYNLGTLLQAKRQLDAAAVHFQAAIACNDNDADAHNNLGLIHAAREDHEAARASFHHALTLNADDVNACNNLGAVLHRLNRLEESAKWCRRALSLDPNCVAAHINMGAVLLKQKSVDQAISEYQRAIASTPDSVEVVEAYTGLGAALTSQRHFDQAQVSYRKALHLLPDCEVAYRGLADLCVKLQDYEGAIENYNRALAIKPGSPAAVSLFFARRHLCAWQGDAESARDVLIQIEKGVIDPWELMSITDSAEDQLRCAQVTTEKLALSKASLPWAGRRVAHPRIRIAYVSADFRNHPVAQLLAGVLERHDRGDFEVLAVSLRPEDGSEMGQRVKRAVDRYFDASAMSDQDLVSLMRKLEVDIAVDLAGFTDGGRMGMFAARAAPVQVNFLGYAGTLGVDCYDYIVADKVTLPAEHQRHYIEKVAYLPDTFMPTDRSAGTAEHVVSRAALGLPASAFVFCSFNNSYKFNPSMFDIWMRLLAKVEGSVLWLPRHQPKIRENLRSEAAARGIAPVRLVFATYTDTHAEHLARLKAADLFLDTLPYNAHTTAVDALRAGLPVLTCLGNAFAARVAGSLLTAIGIKELITTDLEHYEARALHFATRPDLLRNLRARLEKNVETAPLFDTERYARNLEAAFTIMLKTHLSGTSPASFEVTVAV